MREVFRQDLQQVADRLTEIATLVRQAIEDATVSLRTADLELAERTIEADRRIDELQQELDELSIQILALQAPVAADLRNVVAALRMSASLERMGDLARHVAQQARIRYPENSVPEPLRPLFEQIGAEAIVVADLVIALLDSRGVEQVPLIVAQDEKLDELHQQVFAAIASPEWSGTGAEAVDAALLSRYYERFGDHAVSVSGKVEYLLTGNW